MTNENELPDYPNTWIPVYESRYLKKSQIELIHVFGKDLVVFRGMSGEVHVWDAYCPHLGANLGVGGVVTENTIRCPFHGWEFNTKNGVCDKVPGLECKSGYY